MAAIIMLYSFSFPSFFVIGRHISKMIADKTHHGTALPVGVCIQQEVTDITLG